MRTNIWRLTGIISALAFLVSPIYGSSSSSTATHNTQSTTQDPNIRVIQASYVGVSQPLRSLAPNAANTNSPNAVPILQDRLIVPITQNSSDDSFDATTVQEIQSGTSMPTPIANFEGVNNINYVLPPDTQGDIGNDPATGKKYYVQWVNLSFKIWDVTDPAAPVSVYGPAAGNTLWSGTGTLCASNNNGDPITQYDHLAERWMMSQFALNPPNNYHQCIAVSATADPTGAWYLYDYQTSTIDMNDYPKFGVWPDGYYMSVNQFIKQGNNYNWAGAGVAVFERNAMLAGSSSARMIYIDIGAVTLNYGGMLPSDLDGPAPAAGTPNYFVEWDNTSSPGNLTDTLRIWEFKTDWINPTNAKFGLNSNYAPNLNIPTANMDPNMCNGLINCIPQPGTSQKLDAIADRLMYRLQYRNFGSYQTLVSNHTVDANGADQAGIYWFELRNTGTGFAMYQQGTYAPGSDNRWMGSIAMDASGDIALGFSISSSTTYPSIRYTGRLAGDPLNNMAQGETSLIAGTGSQTYPSARWGDYSMMAVDDADGCTFWYTQQYYANSALLYWQTRIGSFKFTSCTTPTAITLDGTVTDATSAPLEGATINVSSGFSTVTDEAGHYALSLEDGAYSITASKYGYVSSTIPGVIVMPPGISQDFTLDTAPISTISGIVTDATTGWPVYARIDISGFPGSPVFTDPVTGAFIVALANGSYTFTVNALSGGYIPTVLPLDVIADGIHNFALTADLIACKAPGYSISPGVACAPLLSSGLIIGSVFDANTRSVIVNPSVKDTNLNPALLIDNYADASQAHPMYIISEPAGAVHLTASASFYDSDTQAPLVVANNTVRQDFNLSAGVLDTYPTQLAYAVDVTEPTDSKLLTLSNSGGASVSYEVFAIPGIFAGYVPVGPFTVHTRHFGPKNLVDLDASQIRIDLTPLNVPMINGGTVSASWLTGLTYAWGIGFNNHAADLWLGDLITAEGDGFNHRFTTDGVNTGDMIDTSSWVSSWNADMTYNPFTNMLWQVTVGGDNCIYELDPTTKTSTGNKICPDFGTSERGLAFDPLTNTYYSGSWNDGIINHFASDSTLIDSAGVNLSISGLAFNPSTSHLFAITSNTHPENVFDVYVLDTKNAYKILGGFNLKENGVDVFTTGGQAGLEMDCSGNLWAVDQFTQKVYVADSGETGVCDWQAMWLSIVPHTGNVPVGDNGTLNVSVDAAGMQLGTHQAYLRVVSDTPYGDQIVPVTLKFVDRLFFPVMNR